MRETLLKLYYTNHSKSENTPAGKLIARRLSYQKMVTRNNTLLPTVRTMAQDFRDSKCSDVRDKVFGILSICRECCSLEVCADYSLDLASICAKLVDHEIRWHDVSAVSCVDDFLEILGMASGTRETTNSSSRTPWGISIQPRKCPSRFGALGTLSFVFPQRKTLLPSSLNSKE